MRHKWLPVACTAVALLAAGCSSSGGMSTSDGEKQANAARRTTAQLYWTFVNSLGAPLYSYGGTGEFTGCGGSGSSSASYVVRAMIRPKSQKGVTHDSLVQNVADKLAGAGWHLSPDAGDERSAEKDGVKVSLEPPEVGQGPVTALQIEGKCTDVGDASDVVKQVSGDDADKYNTDDAAKSPVPTAFPSPSS